MRIDRTLLACAMLVPVVYFGIQLALAPLFPGYDVLVHPASLLGSDQARHADWFNGGAILAGLLGLAGAIGIFRAARALAPLWVRVVLLIVLLLLGCAGIWAGSFALPDPRHAANPFAPAMFATPFLLMAASWLSKGLGPLRLYLTLNIGLFFLIAAVMSGITPLDPALVGGAFQRLLAAAIFVPVGVIGWWLSARLRTDR